MTEVVLQRLGIEQSVDKKKKSFRYPPPVVVQRRRKLTAEEEAEEQASTSRVAEESKQEREAPSINLRRRRVIAPIQKKGEQDGLKGTGNPKQREKRRPALPPIPDVPLPRSLPIRLPREAKKPRHELPIFHPRTQNVEKARHLLAASPSIEPIVEGKWKKTRKEERRGRKRLPQSDQKQLHKPRENAAQSIIHGESKQIDADWQALKEEGQAPPRQANKRARILHEVGKEEREKGEGLQHLIVAVGSITLEDPVTREKKTFPVYRDEDVFGKEAGQLLYGSGDEEEEESVGEDDLPTTKAQWRDGLKRNKERVREAVQFLSCLAEVNPSALSVDKRIERWRRRTQRKHKEFIA